MDTGFARAGRAPFGITEGTDFSAGRTAKGTRMDTWTFAEGEWVAGSPPVLRPRSNAMWLSSIVFDGARAIAGAAPDLDAHCARVIRSARTLGLAPMLTAGEITEIAWEGIHRFPAEAELYICPMFYAESGFIVPDPGSTRFVLSVHDAPLPRRITFSACLSPFRRPSREAAPTDAKASCLYPNVARALAEARTRGFDTAVMLDPSGNVAEFCFTNLFLGKDGVVHTPVPNGTFLDGITRQRVIQLLRKDGVRVEERTVEARELLQADEIFATGNWMKVAACTRYADRHFVPGPLFERAHELYWAYAETCR